MEVGWYEWAGHQPDSIAELEFADEQQAAIAWNFRAHRLRCPPMLRWLSGVLVGALSLAACSGGSPAALSTPTTRLAPTTTSAAPPTTTSTSTTLAHPTTTPDNSVTPDIDAAIPEKHLDNYLASLAAGAYDVASFPISNAGMSLGDDEDIDPQNFLRAACDPDLCNGPYRLEPADPFIHYDGIAPPRWNFTVTHEPSGQAATMTVGMFEDQFVITALPPLVESPPQDGLLKRLFGDDQPAYAVVERFSAFEIQRAETTTWTTNWFANNTWFVEGDYAISYGNADGVQVSPLTAPENAVTYECPDIIIREGRTLVLDRCDPIAPGLYEIETADRYPFLIDPSEVETYESGSVEYLERGGIAIVAAGDAEGNTRELISTTGADLLGGDYAGYRTLSADGQLFLYTDHSQDSGTYNHFWSPVVVVRATDTGAELQRLVLDGPVTCLESDGRWVIVCEGDLDRMIEGDPGIVALFAYNLATEAVNRVETGTRVFLPAQP
ncbi:MAG: hypothetical protein OEY55_07215 [Acidimicrobiia bacterium]|nr:hypothetical protein [Acidimicrobiia bacterium]